MLDHASLHQQADVMLPKRKPHLGAPGPIRGNPRGRMLAVLPFVAALGAWGAPAHDALAFTVTVPDHTPFIQTALDSGARVVYVRPGSYPEHIVLRQPADILALTTVSPAPADSLPEIAGMTLDDFPPWDCKADGDVRFVDVHFTGPVVNTFETNDCANSLALGFVRCVLDSGLTDEPATYGGQLEWQLRSCTVHGEVRLRWPQYAFLADNLIVGTLAVRAQENLGIFRNRLVGPGSIGIATFVDDRTGTISDNRVTGFVVGISGGEGTTLTGNRIEDCDTGIEAGGPDESYDVRANTVRRCGRAMNLRGRFASTIADNLVEDCAAGISHTGEEVVVQRNLVRRCGTGLEMNTLEELLTEDNRVEQIQGIGIWATNGDLVMTRDTVVSCGEGIVIGGGYDVRVSNARVLGCAGRGIAVLAGLDMAHRFDVFGNVVGRCGGDGFALMTADEYSTAHIQGNTSYLNEGSGFAFTAGRGADHVLDHNLSYGNRRHGLALDAVSFQLACNDWFANDSGAVSGGAPGPTDLAVDPLFCDLAADDVHLRSDSPLADAPGCGLIGALGVSCSDAPTPVVVRLFRADRDVEGIRIRWQLDGFEGESAWIERAEQRAGPWTRPATERFREAGTVGELDRDAEHDRSYFYRLVLPDPEDHWVLAEIEVARALEDVQFEITGIAPNPASGAMTIGFSTGSEAPITIEVFDLQGRRVATLAAGAWAAGRHEVQWTGAGVHGAPTPPGIYLLRLRYPGASQVRRILRSR